MDLHKQLESRWVRRLHQFFWRWGFDPVRFVRNLRSIIWIRRDWRLFKGQWSRSSDGGDFAQGPFFPVGFDRSEQGGAASGHYFHQDLIVAQDIFERQPNKHLDVGSRVDGFVAHVASFRQIDVLDVRPNSSSLRNIRFVQGDLTSDSLSLSDSYDSVSCLHAIEHFGLGRYGDRVLFDGWRVGLARLTELTIPSGFLYLSVPTSSNQRVEFNAHRVFSIPYLRTIFQENFELVRLDFVNDSGYLISDVDPLSSEANRSFDAWYGCSIWTLKRRGAIAEPTQRFSIQ